MSCGILTSRECCSLCAPSSATQGISQPMSLGFQMDQTPPPTCPLLLSLLGCPPLYFCRCPGSGCRPALMPAAGSCSRGCCPRRSGPEPGTEGRTPPAQMAAGSLGPGWRRRRCLCLDSHRRCSSTDMERPGRSAMSRRWSGLRQTSQSWCFGPGPCRIASAPGQNSSPSRPSELWVGSSGPDSLQPAGWSPEPEQSLAPQDLTEKHTAESECWELIKRHLSTSTTKTRRGQRASWQE